MRGACLMFWPRGGEHLFEGGALNGAWVLMQGNMVGGSNMYHNQLWPTLIIKNSWKLFFILCMFCLTLSRKLKFCGRKDLPSLFN